VPDQRSGAGHLFHPTTRQDMQMTNANRLLIVEDDPSVKDLVALVGAKAG
jgi:hypothetical protein